VSTEPPRNGGGDQTALADLQKAIETHAKLCLLAKQLPERLAAAQEAVDAAYARLGITAPGTHKGNARRGETRDAILAALPATQPQIREATGMTPGVVSATINTLIKQGRIVADTATTPRTYRAAA